MTRSPVGIAVVGLGYWGPNLLRNLVELSGATVLAMCDSDPSKASQLVHRYPAVRYGSSYAEILADPTIEAVVLATPVETHYSMASSALRAGKHLFVEKPLARTVDQCEDLAAIARAADLILMPGHTFLYSPPVTQIKTLLDDGALGDVYFASTSRVNLGIHQSDANVVWDLGPHDFSILQYWFGETPERVSAVGRACIVPGTPDVAFVSLTYNSGCIAHVELSWLSPSKLRRTTLVGTDKMVVYDDTSAEPVRIFDSGVSAPPPETFGEYRLTYRTGDILSPRIAPTEPLRLELEDFLVSVRTGSTPRSNADLATDVVRVAAAAERSMALGGNAVPVARDRVRLE